MGIAGGSTASPDDVVVVVLAVHASPDDVVVPAVVDASPDGVVVPAATVQSPTATLRATPRSTRPSNMARPHFHEYRQVVGTSGTVGDLMD